MSGGARLDPDGADGDARRDRTAVIALLLLVLLVFGRTAGHDFSAWDDLGTISGNPMMLAPLGEALRHHWTTPNYGLYVPATYTAWSVLAQAARVQTPGPDGAMLNPWLFHGFNIALHAASACLAYGLLRRLGLSALPAFFGAALWAAHPAQVEAVAWTSGAKDLLAGLLGLAALHAWLAHARRDRDAAGAAWTPWLLGAALLIAAMLAKPSAMTIPLLAAAIDRLIVGRPWARILPPAAGWLLLVAPLALVARLVQSGAGIDAAPLWARPLIVGDSLAFYLRLILFPMDLMIDHGRRPGVVLGSAWVYVAWLAPAAVAALAWRRRRREPHWLAAVLVLFLAPLPTLGVVTFLFQFTSTVTEHYLYVAMLGPALAAGYALQRFGGRWQYATATVVLAGLAIRSFAQAGVWRDDLALFGHAARRNPESFLAHNNLGLTLERAGRFDEALTHYLRSIEINPRHWNAMDNVASSYVRRGRHLEAIDMIERSLAIKAALPPEARPDMAEDLLRLAEANRLAGRTEAARAHLRALLAIHPRMPAARRLLDALEAGDAPAP